MSGGRVNWYGDQFKRELVQQVTKSVSAAAIYLSGQTKADISQPGTLRYGVPGKGKKPRQKTIYNFTHSKPGNPPYKQTGRLRGSIAWELVGVGRGLSVPVGRVGTNVRYGRWLELGTKRMAARPFLEVNLVKHKSAIVAILTRTVRPGGLPRIQTNQFRSGVLGRGAAKAGY